jgi:hypothetical protein
MQLLSFKPLKSGFILGVKQMSKKKYFISTERGLILVRTVIWKDKKQFKG